MDTVLSPVWLPSNRAQTRPTAARLAVKSLFFMNGLLFASWASRIPALQMQRGLSNSALGVALLAIALGAVVAMPLAGMLTARIGSDRLCKIAALLYCGLLPVVVLTPNLLLFALALFGFGASHGALDVAMNAQAVAVEKRYREPIMSSFHALWSTGGLVGAATGGLLAAKGLTPLAHVTIVALLSTAVGLLVFPRLLPNGERVSADDLPEKPAPVFVWPGREMLALGAIALCVMMGEGAMADWSAVYLHNILRTREGLAAAGYAAFSIAMAAGRFFGDSLSGRFGPVKLVRMGGMLAAVGLALALLSKEPAVALAGFACVGVGFATVVPMVFSAAGNIPGVSPGVALASVTTLGYLGFLIGPPFIGLTAGFVGLRHALGAIVVTSLMAVALARTVRRASHV